jgi:hypothetical protein
MTTFHEPQPQSRRAVRQNERADSSPSGFVPFPPNQAVTAPNYYSDPNAPRDMWDTTARRAAQPPVAPRTETPPTSGRRAAAAPQPAPEPLTYSTQSGPHAPVFEAPAYPSPPAVEPATQAMPSQDQPTYRVRDFSPDGRRAARAAQAAPTFAAPSDLEYHTEARVPAPPVAPAAAAMPQVTEQTLTRRELRAIQHSEPEPVSAPAPYPITTPESAYPLAATVVPAPVPPIAPSYPAPALEAQPAPEYVAQPSAFEALFQSQALAAPVQPTPLPLVAPEPSPNTAMTRAIAEFDALSNVQPPAATSQRASGESVWTPPTGHWSAQLDADDDPFENTLSRSIGSGHTATNALVLPGMPKETDIRGPLTSTGEVMLTGSIDLPRSLASTGATGRMEHGGIDALFDANDAEINSTDSSPVRAIRAVSTHNSGHGVTHTQKPKGTKALTALLIAASSMAVVVAGLLIAAFAFNVF